MNNWVVGLGYCGPTDCCLTLTGSEGTKEYLIESIAWLILDKYWDIKAQKSFYIDPNLASWIWNSRQEDEKR
jgi:hypothetical protein